MTALTKLTLRSLKVRAVNAPLARPVRTASGNIETDDPEGLQRRLFDEHRIEVVVRGWEGRSLVRVSIAPYNDAADVEKLIDALAGYTALPKRP